MAPNDSRHLLPINSMLFNSHKSALSRRSTTSQNQTLANLQEAQDTTITALPQRVAEQPPTIPKESIWSRVSRVCSKIKAVFFRRKKSLNVGSPTGFQHLETGGPEPLRTIPPRAAMVAGAKRNAEGTVMEEGSESDWEDVDETRLVRKK
ncbi:Nn.00g063490.m01.CDS01 [Neocucurbitaria sp. VM-36]